MNITDQDIIRTARQLRDEENEQLHVRPEFNRTRPWRHIPTWLIAIPAAAIVGFFVGIWTEGSQNDAPLTARVDTVYVQMPVSQPKEGDTVYQPIQTMRVSVSNNTTHPSSTTRSTSPSHGRSVAEDNIRYDLLVMN
jgi:hypothetical protein